MTAQQLSMFMAKLQRRAHAMPKSTISIDPSIVSRIKDIPKAKKVRKCA